MKSVRVLLLIRVGMGFKIKSDFVAALATLGNLYNLHKSKMAAVHKG